MYSRLNFFSGVFPPTYSQTANISLLGEKNLKEFPLGKVSFPPLSEKIDIATKVQPTYPPEVVEMSSAAASLTFYQSYPKAERAFQATLRACQ